jgi:hypothetical protein
MYDLNYWTEHTGSLFHQIFMITAGLLGGVANISGTTYNVVNIFVYYVLIPSSWIYLISRKTTPWLNIIPVILFSAFFLPPDLIGRSDHLFELSVNFLKYTAEIFHSNYIDMSVYICIVIVAVIYLVLIFLTLPKKTARIIFISLGILFLGYMILIFPTFNYLLEKAGKMLKP